jgi:hypothetical protein
MLDLSDLEQIPHFRSDQLYFIRMAGGYIRSIFWDVFLSSNKNRRKILYEVVDSLQVPTKDAEGHRIFCNSIKPNLETKRREGVLDCLSGKFAWVLKNLPEAVVEVFEGAPEQKGIPKQNGILQQNHGIFLKFKDDKKNPKTLTFVRAIEILYKRRNFLEHFSDIKERKKYNKRRDDKESGCTDAEFLEALGIFLLPETLHHFAGRVASYEAKQNKATDNAKIIREQAIRIVKERRQNTKNIFAVERTRQNIKDKSKRKKMVDDFLPWRVAYREMSPSKTDYKENEFRIRYQVIGKNHIEKIRQKLMHGQVESNLHFKRDIEGFYLLTFDINLIIHRFFEELKESGAGLDDLTKKAKCIRNQIAHGGFFWDVQVHDSPQEVYDVGEVFTEILSAAQKAKGYERVNDLFTQIEKQLRQENFSVVDIQGVPPQTLHITKWAKQDRKKYLENPSDEIQLDRRKLYRAEIARWMRALNKAKQQIFLEKRRKKCEILTA